MLFVAGAMEVPDFMCEDFVTIIHSHNIYAISGKDSLVDLGHAKRESESVKFMFL